VVNRLAADLREEFPYMTRTSLSIVRIPSLASSAMRSRMCMCISAEGRFQPVTSSTTR